ncbi:MAG: sigma-70 family RNA polymerase sigma factor [Gemmatales bacterium]
MSMGSPASDHDLFLSLLATHQRQLLKVCWVYGASGHDRDDLLQEITRQLWASFPRYDRSRSFSTWMYRVALNVAIDQRRRSRRAAATVSLVETDAMEDDDHERREQLAELRELLLQQSEADRALLLLHLEGHTHREISDILGITETNVGTRLNRLKQSLRQSAQKGT